MDWNTAVIAVISGTLPIIAKALFDSVRNKNSAADIVVDSSIKVMEKLEKRIEDLECEIKKLKKREAKYMRNQKELLSVIKELKDVMIEQGIDYDVEPILEDVNVD